LIVIAIGSGRRRRIIGLRHRDVFHDPFGYINNVFPIIQARCRRIIMMMSVMVMVAMAAAMSAITVPIVVVSQRGG